MKIITVEDLKHPHCEGQFYLITDPQKANISDPRPCGCVSQAILNATLFLKDKKNKINGRTPYEEMLKIQESINEVDNGVEFNDMMKHIDKSDLFNSCRLLVMNPNAMEEEIFLKILLARLSKEGFILILMEVPEGDQISPKNKVNHASFIHYYNRDIYMDSLKINLDFLIKILYYSKATTMLFFTFKEEV